MKHLLALVCVVGLVAGGLVYGITRSADAPAAAAPAAPAVSCCASDEDGAASAKGERAPGCCAGDVVGSHGDDDCASCS